MPTSTRGVFARVRVFAKLLIRLGEARPDAVNRWVRTKTKPAAEAFARRVMRPKLQWQQRAHIRALEDAIIETEKHASWMAAGGFTDSHVVFNVALHFLLAERDIQALKTDMLTHPDPWVRGLALRVTLLTIYEWDVHKVTGAEFQRALAALPLADEARAAMRGSLRAVGRIRDRIVKQFGDVRNHVIAHRDADALAQYRMLRRLNADDVLPLVVEFYDAVRMFIGALPEVIVAAGCTQTLFNQMLEKGARLPGSHS